MFQDVWKTLIHKELGHLVNGDMEPWSCCLATMGLCLVISEVGSILTELTPADVKGEWLQQGNRFLSDLNSQFPFLLYQRYQEWECLEVGGVKGVPTDDGGLIFMV
jgi:hypothetical protein